jgi:dihydroorotase
MKIIDAVTATSEGVKRQQIRFDENNGLIESVGSFSDKADYYYDDDCLLFAGMGDIHIHAREDVSGKNNYKEDFSSACCAMKNGGVVHAGDMPNNPIPPVDDKSYTEKFKLADKVDHQIWFYAGIGPETRPLSFTVPYKVYMGPSIGELYFKDLQTLDETLAHYKGRHVSFHCEDPEVLDAYKTESTHHERRPVKAEAVATKDALMLIEKYNLIGKLCHYSSQEGLNLVREARKRGVNVSLEVTPQHLFFDIQHLDEKDYKKFQMNPPIRFETDRKALKEALLKGEIQYLATDHAPHTQEEKEKGTSGLTGLDTYGGFVTWLLQDGYSPELVAKITAENPGDFQRQFLPTWKLLSSHYMKFGEGFGYLKPNYSASFTVLRTKAPITITKDTLATKVKHSPFEGVTFPGRTEAVFFQGRKA